MEIIHLGKHSRCRCREGGRPRNAELGGLHGDDAEYGVRCSCRTSCRSWPLGVPHQADDDDLVRAAVLDRILEDGLNVQRTRAARKRDFLLELSRGFVYDGLDAERTRLNSATQRLRTLRSSNLLASRERQRPQPSGR